MKFASIISRIGKPVNAQESLINRSSKWIAERFGVSRRTAQRWKAGTQQPSDRDNRRSRVMASANGDTRRQVAANALRNAQTVHIGNVKVRYSSEKPTTRKINKSWRVTPAMREHLDRAASHLEAGNTEAAEREMNAAVMNRYAGESTRGGSAGIGAWLTISDWGDGFDVT